MHDDDDDDDDEETLRDRIRWWFAARRSILRNWYRRTFHRKQWEADRARFSASLKAHDDVLKGLYTPAYVEEMANKPHPLASLIKKDVTP